MVLQASRLDIPKPILLPNELILKLTPVRKCCLVPSFSPDCLSVQQESIFEFYGKGACKAFEGYSHQDSGVLATVLLKVASHQYCLVYLTTLRLIFIPFSKDINNFKLSYSFALPIRQIEKCHVEKNADKGFFTILISFYIATNLFTLETSSLQVQSKSKRRIIDIASLISAIRYAYSVGRNLTSVEEAQGLHAAQDSHIQNAIDNSDYDYEVITKLDTGYELFYHQLDPKLQNACGFNNFVNADDVIYDHLPNYDESEKAVGKFFKSLGLLNQIVIRDRNYLEILQNHSSSIPNTNFDYYYENDINSEFRPFLFINQDEFDNEYGNYYYKFLAENALRYSERNIDDIVQVIYDNLHNNLAITSINSSSDEYNNGMLGRGHSDPNLSLISSGINNQNVHEAYTYGAPDLQESLFALSSVNNRSSAVRNSFVTITNNAPTILLNDENHEPYSNETNGNEEIDNVRLSCYTNNTNAGPNALHTHTASSSLGNIQDLIATDADTSLAPYSDFSVRENGDDSNGVSTNFKSISLSRVPSEVNIIANDIENISARSSDEQGFNGNSSLDFFNVEDYSRIAQFLEGSSSIHTGSEEESDSASPLPPKSIEDGHIGKQMSTVEEKQPIGTTEFNHPVINEHIHSSEPSDHEIITKHEQSDISSCSKTHVNLNYTPFMKVETPTQTPWLPSSPRNYSDGSLHGKNSFRSTRTASSGFPASQSRSGNLALRILIPNEDFILDNNKFLENATDQSTTNFLSQEMTSWNQNKHGGQRNMKSFGTSGSISNRINKNSPANESMSSTAASPSLFRPATPITFKNFNLFNSSKSRLNTMSQSIQNGLDVISQDHDLEAQGPEMSSKVNRKASSPQLRMKVSKHIRSPTMIMKNIFSDSKEKISKDTSNQSNSNAANRTIDSDANSSISEIQNLLGVDENAKSTPSQVDILKNEEEQQAKDELSLNKLDKKLPVFSFQNLLASLPKDAASEQSDTDIAKDQSNSPIEADLQSQCLLVAESKNDVSTDHERTSSSMSGGSIDVCPFYYDPENPYADIINNRMKYNNDQARKKKKSHGNQRSLMHGHFKFGLSRSSADLSKELYLGTQHAQKLDFYKDRKT